MAVVIATWFWLLVGCYAAIGVCFSLFFLVTGLGRFDPVAKAGTWGFRVLVAPGVVALWPLFLKRMMTKTSQPPPENNAHRKAAKARLGGGK